MGINLNFLLIIIKGLEQFSKVASKINNFYPEDFKINHLIFSIGSNLLKQIFKIFFQMIVQVQI